MSGEREKPAGSITLAIKLWGKERDQAAFEKLFAFYKDYILHMAEIRLRYQKGKPTAPEDVVGIVLADLAKGIDEERTWFIRHTTDRDKVLKLIGRLVLLRCCKINRSERSGVRGKMIRDADLSNETGHDQTIFVDREHSNWEADCRLAVEEIEEALRKLNGGQYGEKLVLVFRGMLNDDSNNQIAAAIDHSPTTVTRYRAIVRALAARLLEIKEQFNQDVDGQTDE